MFKCKLQEKISLNSNKISNKIDYFLLKNLKKKVGNKCLKEGYVIEKSINIISKSLGNISPGHINNNIYFDVSYTADIFNPGIGIIIPKCRIIKKTKMGLIAEGCDEYPINILIASRHNSDNIKFKKYKENDYISIELIGKKYDVNSKKIYGIGKIVDDVDGNEDSSDNDDDNEDEDGSDNDDVNEDGSDNDDVNEDGSDNDDVNKDGSDNDDVNEDGSDNDDVNEDGSDNDDVNEDGSDNDDVNEDGSDNDDVNEDGSDNDECSNNDDENAEGSNNDENDEGSNNDDENEEGTDNDDENDEGSNNEN